MYGQGMEGYPTHCRNGHEYAPYKVVVGFRHCGCEGARETGGHISYKCLVEGCEDRLLHGCVDQGKSSDYRPGGAPWPG